MDDSPAISTETEQKVVYAATPLMHVSKNGQHYKRRPDVEAQINEMLAREPSTWEPNQLKSESLVSLIRWLWLKDDKQNIGRLIECLGGRIAMIASDFTSGFNQSTADDFGTDVAYDVCKHIFAPTPTRQSEFLEISFRQAVERRAINRRSKLKYRRKHERPEAAFEPATSDEGEIGIVESHADGAPGPEETVIQSQEKKLAPERVRAGLSAITDERHREAVILHYLQGWPITDKDPNIPTLKTHFSMSARQIQNWINTARGEMRAALGEIL